MFASFLIRKHDVKYTIMEEGQYTPNSLLRFYITKHLTTKVEDNTKLKFLWFSSVTLSENWDGDFVAGFQCFFSPWDYHNCYTELVRLHDKIFTLK